MDCAATAASPQDTEGRTGRRTDSRTRERGEGPSIISISIVIIIVVITLFPLLLVFFVNIIVIIIILILIHIFFPWTADTGASHHLTYFDLEPTALYILTYLLKYASPAGIVYTHPSPPTQPLTRLLAHPKAEPGRAVGRRIAGSISRPRRAMSGLGGRTGQPRRGKG